MNAESGARVRSRKKGKQPQRLEPQSFGGAYGTLRKLRVKSRALTEPLAKGLPVGRRKIKRAGEPPFVPQDNPFEAQGKPALR
jgi:hypothetical protein